MTAGGPGDAPRIGRWQLNGVAGAVVVVDVLRAFSTAAYAFDAGAAAIYLVAGVDDALAFKAAHPGSLAVGEDRGRRPAGFDLPNSPAAVHREDLTGRTVVQRTSAGTQGVVAAVAADRLWAASLVCASATAAAVDDAGCGVPTYVLTGLFPDRPADSGHDDRLTSDLIERARLGLPLEAAATAASLVETSEAARTLALGPEHCDPADIELAARVDAFDFAMEVLPDDRGLRLHQRR